MFKISAKLIWNAIENVHGEFERNWFLVICVVQTLTLYRLIEEREDSELILYIIIYD